MQNVFDIRQFDQYKEDNRREVKAAEGGLPANLWDTYVLLERSTKELLRLMVKIGKLVDDGATKGKRYQKNE